MPVFESKGRWQVSCKHCEIRAVKHPHMNTFYEGAEYEGSSYKSASIEYMPATGLHELWIEDWSDGETVMLSVGVTHCPWCGDKLKGASE